MDTRSPVDALAGLLVLAAQLQAVQSLIRSMEKRIVAQHRSNEASNRLETIPGIGFWARPPSRPSSPNRKHSGRVVILRPGSGSCRGKIRPAANRSSGRSRNRATNNSAHPDGRSPSVLRRARQQPEKYPWLTQLLARRPFKVIAVALANKMARIAWALLARGGTYRAPATRGSLTRSSAMGG